MPGLAGRRKRAAAPLEWLQGFWNTSPTWLHIHYDLRLLEWRRKQSAVLSENVCWVQLNSVPVIKTWRQTRSSRLFCQQTAKWSTGWGKYIFQKFPGKSVERGSWKNIFIQFVRNVWIPWTNSLGDESGTWSFEIIVVVENFKQL